MDFPANVRHEHSPSELDRLAALRALRLLDSEPEREFDDLVQVAKTVCAVPIAIVSLVDRERQWFKARVGVDSCETSREISFCSHAIQTPERSFEVRDTHEDVRFANSPNVLGPPFIRFYAGFPLVVDGFAVGTICVIDTVPRTLEPAQRLAMAALARGVVTAIKNRRATAALLRAESRRTQAERDLTVFSAAFEHAHDAILIFTKRPSDKGWPNISYANAAWGRLIGREPTTSVGKSAQTIAGLAGNTEALERIDWTASGNLPTAQRISVPRGDGITVTVEVTVAALPATLRGLHWVVILRDLSDRLAIERAEREVELAHVERAAISASERRLRDLFERTPAITYTLDRSLRFQSSLGGGLRAIGLEPDQLVGSSLLEFLNGPEDSVAYDAHRHALAGESVTYEHDRYGRLYQTFLEPILGEDGSPVGVSAIAFDMTEHKASMEALRTTEEHFARTQRTAQIGTWFHDLVTDRHTYSTELHRIFGVARESADRETFLAQVVPEDRARVRAAIDHAYATFSDTTVEYRIESGVASRWVVESVAFVNDSKGIARHADGIVIDITERREAELEIARLADTDGVTGLPNRAALTSRIASTPVSESETLVVLDLDRFQATNDAFGHTIGDRILRTAAERIVETAPGAWASRLEGDAFALLFPKGVDPLPVCAKLQAAFAAPFLIDRYRLFSSASLGIATCEPGSSAEAFLREAMMAVAAAKASGGNTTVAFTDEVALRHRRRVMLDRDLRGAVDRGEFTVVYQPIVDRLGTIARMEALVRWNHPERGMIAPSEFIPIAEINGEILPIGRFVVQTACAHLRAIREETGASLRVAVNVSARQFADPELLPAIEDALISAELDPSLLELEITESMIASDPQRAGQLLAEIRAAGVSISIDDFGTGYSSLASLQRLPIDTLKIDRSFIAVTPADEDGCAIVEAVLALARRLSLEVVAEGVETAEQAAFLRARGCDFLQGYYFGRPVTANQIAVSIAEAAAASSIARE